MKYLVIQLLLVIINAYHPIAILYRGTVCGWAETTTDQPILCNGLDPRHSCPINYTQLSFQEGVAYCYKTNSTSEPQNGLMGTICGGLARNPCGGISPAVACPPGYIQDFRHVCYKNSSKIEDLSGTFCGIVNDGTGVTCDGVQLGKCPKRYVAINYDEQKWHACTKE